MPSIPIQPRLSTPTANPTPSNPLPHLLQTPTGLAILELQGTINTPSSADEGPSHETPIGKLMFPDYTPGTPAEDTRWMKRVYLYVGRYQRMTGEVKKLGRPLAVVRRTGEAEDELGIVEIVKYKLVFGSRPEPVNDS